MKEKKNMSYLGKNRKHVRYFENSFNIVGLFENQSETLSCVNPSMIHYSPLNGLDKIK
jgi:hypothetical protein